MNSPLAALTAQFSKIRALVLGDALLDRYVSGESTRICREAPVPIVNVRDEQRAPGGAANVAVNLAELGAKVTFILLAGDDVHGRQLQTLLTARGITVVPMILRARETLTKSRLIAEEHVLVRYDEGHRFELSEAEQVQYHSLIEQHFYLQDLTVLSDYGYGALEVQSIALLTSLQSSCQKLIVADSRARLAQFRAIGITAVKPNYEETLALLGAHVVKSYHRKAESLLDHGATILERSGARIAAVTLDREGALIFERGKPSYRTYSQAAPNSRAAGAGDTFVSAFALALAAGAAATEAGEIASAAAEVVVKREGTVPCSQLELKAALNDSVKLIENLDQLTQRLALHRARGERIVFTNGCFDLLHSGHVACLNRAKELGDILVVGVNSDESVRRIKGHGRPYRNFSDRLQVLNALSCIDYLIPFDQDTACALVDRLTPEVFVKGASYSAAALPEAAHVARYGGTLKILPLIADHSTHEIVERIQSGHATVRSAEIRKRARWEEATKIVAIRLDSLGDVIMMEPALRALQESHARPQLSLLTSPAGAKAAALIPYLHESITYEAPWMKASVAHIPNLDLACIEMLRARNFDAAVIFTTFSQSALPAALYCYLADIPLRLGYSRENPYQLLSDWIKETEPEQCIRHEVERQLDLVNAKAFSTNDTRLRIEVPDDAMVKARAKLAALDIEQTSSWILVHPGASAASRRYPAEKFAAVIEQLSLEGGYHIVLSGDASEFSLHQKIIDKASRAQVSSLAGQQDVTELAATITLAPLVISNNTAPVHLAAALSRPIVDLYALTNPQHTPWRTKAKVLSYEVSCRNCFKSICPHGDNECLSKIEPQQVVEAALELLADSHNNAERHVQAGLRAR